MACDPRGLLTRGTVPRMRILVIEDAPGTRAVIQRVLETQLAAEVDVAELGAQAIELLKTRDYDVVLLDHDLPDTTGLTVLEEIQRQRPRPVAIYLTGHGDEEIAQRALSQGAVDYLTKGIDTYSSLPQIIHQAKQRWGDRGPLVRSRTGEPPREDGPGLRDETLEDLASQHGVDQLIVHDSQGNLLATTLEDEATALLVAEQAAVWLSEGLRTGEEAGLDSQLAFSALEGDQGLLASLEAAPDVAVIGTFDAGTTPAEAFETLRRLIPSVLEAEGPPLGL